MGRCSLSVKYSTRVYPTMNPISELHEFSQQRVITGPKFTRSREGADHQPIWTIVCEVTYGGIDFKESGIASDIQEAKKKAAGKVLAELKKAEVDGAIHLLTNCNLNNKTETSSSVVKREAETPTRRSELNQLSRSELLSENERLKRKIEKLENKLKDISNLSLDQ